MRILVTAFTPFNGESINPSIQVLDSLPEDMGSIKIFKEILPTEFKTSQSSLFKKIDEVKPDAVLCLGQAGGRDSISVERVGINIDDAPIPDNRGAKPIDAPIFKDGENAYFSTLPIKGIVQRINDAGIKGTISNSAGTYVCNHILYSLLYYIRDRDIRGGFIHIPFESSQVIERPEVPSMPLDQMVKGIQEAIVTIELLDNDVALTGGSTH